MTEDIVITQPVRPSYLLNDYLATPAEDLFIASLDPLGLDEGLTTMFPTWNNEERISELLVFVQQALPPLAVLETFDQAAAKAATRDIGFLVSALVKHGIDLSAVPELVSSLLQLATKTHEVPRDTFTSYISRNPADQRMRTFTGLPEERLFIYNIQRGLKDLPACIKALEEAQEYSLLEGRYTELLQEAKQSFAPFIECMINVKRNISPEVFSFQIMPFFPPLSLTGHLYSAPAGTQTPLLIVDIALFGASLYGQQGYSLYTHYIDTNSVYLPVVFRDAICASVQRRSLTDLACEEARAYLSADLKQRRLIAHSLRVLEEMIHPLLSFRFPHRKVSEENFRVRPNGAKGSGGYSIEILDLLLDLSCQANQKLFTLRMSLENGADAEVSE